MERGEKSLRRMAKMKFFPSLVSSCHRHVDMVLCWWWQSFKTFNKSLLKISTRDMSERRELHYGPGWAREKGGGGGGANSSLNWVIFNPVSLASFFISSSLIQQLGKSCVIPLSFCFRSSSRSSAFSVRRGERETGGILQCLIQQKNGRNGNFFISFSRFFIFIYSQARSNFNEKCTWNFPFCFLSPPPQPKRELPS